MFDAIAFAGGGNRCYWQGAFYSRLAAAIPLAPKLVVGVSAGAWQAAYALLGLAETVEPAVIAACGPHRRNFDWQRRKTDGTPFPVAALYRELIETALAGDALARLNAITDLRISIARPPHWMPGALAPWLGLLAYQAEKALFEPVHPRFGRALGFSAEFIAARSLRSPTDLFAALLASATMPPVMPTRRLGGQIALDGGLVDNVPVEPLEGIERAGGRTLVLLTRRYRALPAVPGRTYVQPSEPIPIGRFDLRNPEGIRAAFALGRKDAAAFLAAGAARRGNGQG